MPPADRESVYAKDVAALRAWLRGNHARSEGVWLEFDRGSDGLRWSALVPELLAWGWIDSTAGRSAGGRARLWISPRRPRSPWSRINKDHVARLVAAGRMRPPGLAKVEAAKRDGSWSALDAVEALAVPPDLAAALRNDALARRNFEAFPPSARKAALWWIASAKRDETRARRIAETVRLAHRGERPR